MFVRAFLAVFIAGLLLGACPAVFASVNDAELAKHETWLKLIVYERSRKTDSGELSAVLAEEFFLAEDGATDPLNELRATIVAMSAGVDGKPNEHAQCRFPARYIWLKRQSALDGVKDVSCPDFEEWIFGSATESLSIIFATGYLGNPASYYGHTLLKFNSSQARQSSELLDVTVNYGAIIPPNVGPISYMYNGATGGFNAGFSHVQYYFHDHNYGELELRDLWEYELNLSPEEVRFVLAHSWEVLGREYVYYFFRKNCAFRMAEVIEIIDGIELIPPSRPWTVPQSIVRRASQSLHNGDSLVRDVTWHPSRQSIFYENYRQLTRAERDAVQDFVQRSGEAGVHLLLDELPVDEQQRVVETLLDYYQYLTPKDEPTGSPRRQRYRELLARRFSLPAGKRPAIEPPQAGPETDRDPGYLSAGIIHNSSVGEGALLRLRPAYYDALDSSTAHVPNSELSMVQLTLELYGDGVEIREASLFRVEAVNGAISGLPGDKGRSWILAFGLHQQAPGCEECLVARFEADIGRSFPLGNSSVFGFYAGGAVQDNRNDNGHAFARVSAFANMSLSPKVRLRARFEQRYHIESPLRFQGVSSLQMRVALSREWDLRLEAHDNIETTVSLSAGYYW